MAQGGHPEEVCDTELLAGWEGAGQGESHSQSWGEVNSGHMNHVALVHYDRC